MNYLLAGAACLVLLTACAATPVNNNPADGGAGSVADGGGPAERVFGTIEFYGDLVRVVVPSSVQQGQPFAVTVVTYGGSCIEKGETTVEVEALRAEVRPYDYDTTPVGGNCDLALLVHEHTTTLSFAKAGTADIIVHGLKEDASGSTQTSVMRTLEVRQSP